MAVLLTGGTGKTSRSIIDLLKQANTPYVVTSRNPKADASSPTIKFDFLDESTWENAFTHPTFGSNKITAIYLIAPWGHLDPGTVVNGFIDYAHSKHGVQRFVLLVGSTTAKGDPFFGKIWAKLEEMKLEYTVLRPTWFMGESLAGPS